MTASSSPATLAGPWPRLVALARRLEALRVSHRLNEQAPIGQDRPGRPCDLRRRPCSPCSPSPAVRRCRPTTAGRRSPTDAGADGTHVGRRAAAGDFSPSRRGAAVRVRRDRPGAGEQRGVSGATGRPRADPADVVQAGLIANPDALLLSRSAPSSWKRRSPRRWSRSGSAARGSAAARLANDRNAGPADAARARPGPRRPAGVRRRWPWPGGGWCWSPRRWRTARRWRRSPGRGCGPATPGRSTRRRPGSS